MKKYFVFSVVMAVSVLALSGCKKSHVEIETSENDRVCGSTEFMSQIKALGIPQTKSGEISEDEVYNIIEPLYPLAISYLAQNGYDYTEDFSNHDPNIIMTALALYQFDIENSMLTKGSGSSIADVGSCIAIGSTTGALVNAGVKYVAKKIAQAILERAVPGVGIAVGVVMAIGCLSELE